MVSGEARAARQVSWLHAVVFGLILRAAWIGLLGGRPAFDAKTYFDIARQVAVSLGYSVDGQPTAYWPVGYPGALGLLFWTFGPSLTGAFLLNLGCGLGCLLCLHQIAIKLGFSTRVAAWTVLLAAINPVYVSYSSLVVTETFFLFLMLLGIALGLGKSSRTKLLVAGAMFGGAALTRPIGLCLPVLVGVFGAGAGLQPGESRPAKRTLLLCTGLVLVMSPWWIRNAAAFGSFVPVSTNGGVNLYIGNNPQAIGRYRFTEDEIVRRPLEAVFKQGFMGGARELAYDRYASGLAWRFIREQPLRVLALLPRKVLFTYFPDLTGLTWNIPPDGRAARTFLPVVPLLIALHHFVLLGLALAGLHKLRRTNPPGARLRPATLLPGAMIAAFTLVSMVYFGMPRFHFALFPWLELYAAAGLVGAELRPAPDLP